MTITTAQRARARVTRYAPCYCTDGTHAEPGTWHQNHTSARHDAQRWHGHVVTRTFPQEARP